MLPSILWTAALVLSIVAESDAVRLPIEARPATGLVRRQAAPGAPGSPAVSTVPVRSEDGIVYVVNIELGGIEYPVFIDTGSSDLWVSGEVQNTQDLGFSANLSYASGFANGEVLSAEFSFAGFTVPNQAFVHNLNISTWSTVASSENYTGIMGLGPSVGSSIFLLGSNRAQRPDLSTAPWYNQIFDQNTTTQNYMTLLLPRVNDPVETPVMGQLTISEVASGYENILNQTKLPVTTLSIPELEARNTQHFSTPTDENGILDPFGNVLKLSSIDPNITTNRLNAVFDTGANFPQVPTALADAIYNWIEGSVFDSTDGFWTLPCTAETNVTFIFGGQKIFIHPLDMSRTEFLGITIPPVNGVPMCIGTFQPFAEGGLGAFVDMLLGAPIFPNTYMLIDHGDFIFGDSTDREDPFIQMLSLTDPTQAHEDFVKVRLNGTEVPTSRKSLVAQHIGAIAIVAIVLAVLVSCCGCVFCCLRRRRNTRTGPGPRTRAPFGNYFMGGFGRASGKYQPMDAPAPQAPTTFPQFPESSEHVPLHPLPYSDPFHQPAS